MVIILMGVAGAGKTTVGRALATSLDCDFADADDFHSPDAIAKMKSGVPLTDADRAPWLAALNRFILSKGGEKCTVLACSALKHPYRERLAAGAADVRFIYLQISPQLAAERLPERPGHYASAALLPSQFETLEPPSEAEALTIDATLSVSEIVDTIARAFRH